jgi:hypothetical protein
LELAPPEQADTVEAGEEALDFLFAAAALDALLRAILAALLLAADSRAASSSCVSATHTVSVIGECQSADTAYNIKDIYAYMHVPFVNPI